MEAASGLDAGNDENWARWARQLEQEGRSGLPGWRRASAANPRRGEWLVEAALEREATGDLAQAEHLLMEAERFNHLWTPRWSLAGFYLRQGSKEKALQWARSAAERAFGDRRALFALCREAGAGDRRILDEVVGDDPGNLAAFLRDAAQRGSLEALELAAARYLESRRRWKHRAGSPEEALETIEIGLDALLSGGEGAAAVRVAERLAREPWASLEQGGLHQIVANTDFRPPWTGHGFSWRHGEVEGVEVRPRPEGNGVRVVFSGRQPENEELLAQVVYCPRGGTWELNLEYQARDFAPAHAGVRWRLEPFGGSRAAIRLDDAETAWSADSWSGWRERWEVPQGGGVFRLVLAAQRTLGQPRVEGELSFRRIGLRWLQEPGQ
jgi:hypothetical protein